MKKIPIICFCISCAFTLLAQTPPNSSYNLQQLIDDLYNTQDIGPESEELYENLSLILTNPIDLNTATADDFRALYFLSERQIKNLLQYRKENGKLLSVYELQAVPGFDETSIKRLLPFIIIPDKQFPVETSLLHRIIHEKNNYFLLRGERTLEQKQGFTNAVPSKKKFQGSPVKLYGRFRISKPEDFSIGMTFEKDAGETFDWNAQQRGFDFISFHAQLQNKGKLKNIILGDYQMQAGQGLLLGSLFGIGKGGETVTTARRANLGSLPYTASGESGYWRGVTATYAVTENIFVTGFFSTIKRDASIFSDSADTYAIGSIQATGLHRNRLEMEGKGAVDETNYGAILNYRSSRTDAGMIWNATNFALPVNRKSLPYNYFYFNQQVNHNVSFFLNYTLNNVTFFSEVAKSIDGGTAAIAGLLTSLSTQLDFSLVYRNYQKDFHSFYSNTLSENATPQNEQGFYWGWKYTWNKACSLAGYVDLFRFPWLKYRSYRPSEGHEWLLRFNYQLSGNVSMYLQAREENKVRNIIENSTPRYETDNGTKRNYIFSIQMNASDAVQLKTRVQYSTFNFNNKKTQGLALVQDIRWTVGRFTLSARHALFNTDDYDNRQYVYEDDVWLAFSIPAYYGIGLRDYIVTDFSLNQNIQCSLRFAHTRYTDRDSIGSGLDMIDGNTRNDIKFQVRIRL